MACRAFCKSKNGKITLVGFAVLLIVVALVLLVVGVIQLRKKNCDDATEREKVDNFLTKVKNSYYANFPHAIIFDPDVDLDRVIDNFTPYDPTPSKLKTRTDLAIKLRKELTNLNIDQALLKPREKKALAQLEHYLESTFGSPYSENYYAGDWMMGPNYFCWQSICGIGADLKRHFTKDSMPKSEQDVDKIVNSIKKYKATVYQFQANMEYGVRAGMVRAVEDCKSGKNAFKSQFKHIVEKGATGALNESFSKTLLDSAYYRKLSADTRKILSSKYGNSVEMFMADVIVKNIGEPIDAFVKYLENDYSQYCVPSNVSSGLANLPLDYIWINQSKTNTVTTKRLPTGELLDGKKSYAIILPYFTTSKKYNAKAINALGMKQLDQLYVQAKAIAEKITNKTGKAAINEFKQDLNSPKWFFNTTVIPDNENDEEGGRRCKDMDSAKLNCPVRYEAMQRWFGYAQQLLAKIEPMTINMFYMTGEKMTTPICPIKMKAKFNPSSGSQSYSSSGINCTRPSHYMLPFFLKRPGPMYSAYSVAGHEGRPGHHTQVQGFDEHFSTSGTSKDLIDWLNANTYYTAFTEGWALYAENPLLAKETKLYENNDIQYYGMLKWQIWRALRLIIDTGLHDRGQTMKEALDLFEKYAWDTTDKSYKDTIRYMSDPGQATAYMIGQLAIWDMRNKTEQKLKQAGITFDEKEFHLQVLSQGSSPLDYLIGYIDNYIECKINNKARADCPEILNPKLSASQKLKAIGTKDRWDYIRANTFTEHFD